MANKKVRDFIEINNGQYLKVFQHFNGDIVVQFLDADGNLTNFQAIAAKDFVSMLNWYTYQKDNGNKDLMF